MRLNFLTMVVLSLFLADLAQWAYVQNKPQPHETSVREWIVDSNLPSAYRAGTFLVIEKTADLFGISRKLSQRIFHFMCLFFVFLSLFVFIGFPSLLLLVVIPFAFYALYLHDVQYAARITDLPLAVFLCFCLGISTRMFIQKTKKISAPVMGVFFLFCTLASFFRENAAVIPVFLGFFYLFDIFPTLISQKLIKVNWKKLRSPALTLIVVSVFGILLGRILVRLVFPETAALKWNVGPDSLVNGSVWNDIRIYAPVNFGARREIIFALFNQYGGLFLLSIIGLNWCENRNEKILILAALATLAFQFSVYMIMGNAQGENYAAMGMLVGLFIPVGVALKDRINHSFSWKFTWV